MKHMHLVRAFSFVLAWNYNFLYLWAGSEFYWSSKHLNRNDGREDFTALSMLIDLFFMFNLAFYFPIFFMNMIIIMREMFLEFGPPRKLYLGGTRA